MASRKSIYEMGKSVAYAERLIAAGTPLIVFDLETTGLNPNTDRILSFSAIKVVYENGIGIIKEKKDIFLNPGFHIPDKVAEINHISDSVVADCPKENDVIDEIVAFFGEHPFIAGYNSTGFDVKFINALYNRLLGRNFEPHFHIDVFLMAKEKIEGSHKLSDVAQELGVAAGLNFHDSIDDVYATYRSFNILRPMYRETEDEKKEYVPCKVSGARFWKGYNYQQNRIYITTYPQSKTYYNIYNKEWTSDMDFDLDYIRKEIFKKYEVDNEKDLEKKLKAGN